MVKGSSNSSSSKGNSGSSRGAQKPPPNASNAQAKGNTNGSATPKTRRTKPPPRSKKMAGEADEQHDERRYCYCNEVSFGEMIACDGDCAREWYHLPCVKLQVAPKSKWYCDDCDPQFNPKKKQRKT
ncbi:hypothetical protein FRC08_010164 [Ceratobasidium sp. 394]|nr:hypothetical protein FRC08_010164 [Ceratobasidium sp. 394]